MVKSTRLSKLILAATTIKWLRLQEKSLLYLHVRRLSSADIVDRYLMEGAATRAPPSEVETVPQRPTEAADSGRATYRPMSGRAVGPLVFSEDEDEPERRLRWEPPPPDDWWTQWNRTRPEREWYYPAYRGPERFDYPRAPRASGVHRSGSGRDHGPRMSYRPTRYLQPPPPPSNARPSFERDTIPPGPIRGDPEENWDSEEELVTYETGKAGGKSGGRGPPRRPPPTETEGSMRLPFLGWLNTTVKGRT